MITTPVPAADAGMVCKYRWQSDTGLHENTSGSNDAGMCAGFIKAVYVTGNYKSPLL